MTRVFHQTIHRKGSSPSQPSSKEARQELQGMSNFSSLKTLHLRSTRGASRYNWPVGVGQF